MLLFQLLLTARGVKLMKKKTLKIFVNSFIVSLFAIWVVNELFLVTPNKSSQNVIIPEQGIALFLQSDVVDPALSKPVKTVVLNELATAADDEVQIDEDLFTFTESAGQSYAINSVEDVADIPLERTGSKNLRRPMKRPNAAPKFEVAPEVEATPAMTKLAAAEPQTAEPAAVSAAPIVAPENVADEQSAQAATLPAEPIVVAAAREPAESTAAPVEEENVIVPLQRSFASRNAEDIEIATAAPQSQVAMMGDTAATGALAIEKQNAPEEKITKVWHPMSEESNDSPWVVAKGNKFSKNSQVAEQFANISDSEVDKMLNMPKAAEEGEEVQVTEMVKNILIPIPEDIMNDKNLTPQLVSPKKNKNAAEEDDAATESENTEEKKEGILKSIASIFSSKNSDEADKSAADESDNAPKKKGLFSAFDRKEKSSFKKILPAEMKLSFQPGRAEISGQTLRWIEAFANKAIEDDSVILQIRIDQTSSFELQQKRLNLLHNILTNKGVGYHKIDTVLTSREPNSFIIRTLKINDNSKNDSLRSNNRKALNYQSW